MDKNNEREVLLKRVQVCDFLLVEANLFLDTHPDCEEALNFFKKHLAMKQDAVEAYVKKYGPLTTEDYDGGPRWNWVDGPWPWEMQGEV